MRNGCVCVCVCLCECLGIETTFDTFWDTHWAEVGRGRWRASNNPNLRGVAMRSLQPTANDCASDVRSFCCVSSWRGSFGRLCKHSRTIFTRWSTDNREFERHLCNCNAASPMHFMRRSPSAVRINSLNIRASSITYTRATPCVRVRCGMHMCLCVCVCVCVCTLAHACERVRGSIVGVGSKCNYRKYVVDKYHTCVLFTVASIVRDFFCENAST